MFLKLKKKDPELLEKQRKAMTANEFVNVSDIQGYISYGKNDGMIYTYIRVQPVNLELLSNSEKEVITQMLSSELSSQKKVYKIFTIPRPIDVSRMISRLKNLKDTVICQERKKLAMEEIQEISGYALSGEIRELQFYIVMWEKDNKEGEKELLKRAYDMMSRLKKCNVTTFLSIDKDIIKLFNLFANPTYAHMEDGDVNEYIPLIQKIRKKEASYGV